MANPWLALDSAFMFDSRVMELGCRFGPGGPLTWVVLLSEAKRTRNNGTVEMTWQALARAAFLEDADQAREVVAALDDLGVLNVTPRNADVMEISIENWSKYQFDPRSRALNRERQARHRAKKQANNASVTPSNGKVTTKETETETNTKNHGGVEEVFNHWSIVHGKARAKLNAARKKKVEARLREGYSVADLKAAVEGCRASEFHMGGNRDKRVYDELALICRDGAQVEKFIELAKSAPKEETWWENLS